MITLPNSCYCSDIKVIPKNWKSAKSSISKDWIIYYRFYDPALKNDPKFKKGKLVRIKSVNSFNNLSERQKKTEEVIQKELARLKEEAYNPITGTSVASLYNANINPTTPFYQALVEVEKNITVSKSTKRDLRSLLNFVSLAANQLGIYHLPVKDVSRKHIKMILAQIEINQGKESVHRYNKNRTYLMILFKELVELETVDTNPVREISKKQRVIALRKVLTEQERKKVNDHLKANHYRFWLFTNIFFHSGARLTEIMQVKRKDVDLNKQQFLVTIKKGKQVRQVLKPIKNNSVQYWREAVMEANQNDYIFSIGLMPGMKRINTDQITKRWKKYVKTKLNIDADFYSLKHLHLDEIAKTAGIEDAAAMASHTTTDITLRHYAINETRRRNERLKTLNVDFVS